MKVFVLKHLLICDFDILTNSVEVYKNEVKAKKAYKKLSAKARVDCQREGWDIEDDTDTNFSAGVDGSWAEFSEYCSLEEKELL